MLTRRGFIAATAAAGAMRVAPMVATRGRWVMKVVYDKSSGAMRVVERWVP